MLEIKEFVSTKILNDSTRAFSPVIYFPRCGAKGIFEISICSKGREDLKRKERNGKAEESKGEERSSCVYCMRVEFYACLIWKWIAWECGSMRRVEETGRGSRRRTRAKEREQEKQVKWTVSSSLPFPAALILVFPHLRALPFAKSRDANWPANS